MNFRGMYVLVGSLLLFPVTGVLGQVVEPNWRPVGTTRVTANWNNSATPAGTYYGNAPNQYGTTAVPVVSGGPVYYRPSPLFQPGGLFYQGAPPVSMPVNPMPTSPQVYAQHPGQQPTYTQILATPVVQSNPVMAATQSLPQPQSQQPTGNTGSTFAQPAPVASAPLPQAVTQTQPTQQFPPAPSPQVQNEPAAPPSAPPQSQIVAGPVPPSPPADEPYLDSRVVHTAGRAWDGWDLAPYTSRFHPMANSEQAVREWVNRLTGYADWNGPETADLRVSSTEVAVYHTPQVREEVQKIVGRFTNYAPGRLNCEVQLFNVESAKWFSRYKGQLQSLEQSGDPGNGRHVWMINNTAAQQFANDMRKGLGALLLSNEQFTVINGQKAQVVWTKDPSDAAQPINRNVSMRPKMDASGSATVDLNVDGVVLEFSPLIEQDAASVDVALHLGTRSTARKPNWFQSFFRGNSQDLPNSTRVGEVGQLVALPPGKHLLVALDGVPTFNPKKRLFNADRDATILALIRIVPDQGNMIVGEPTDPATAQSTSAKPPLFEPSRPAGTASLAERSAGPVSSEIRTADNPVDRPRRPQFALFGRSL